ncbi:hypothetical protein [Lysobacter sp. Root604]|uniref:hypothetical protein n=1 Tax=Lysobacter sp. Root604 TaxID=1736568 RepID=UPI0006FD3C84|nr:hypothetical protein [Lysobacter sp. Root604]KRA16803.1 hypothetical protein ASD69_08575 [Lysobacter sp. Root604]
MTFVFIGLMSTQAWASPAQGPKVQGRQETVAPLLFDKRRRLQLMRNPQDIGQYFVGVAMCDQIGGGSV